MLGTLFDTIFTTPILNTLVTLYKVTGNLGISIILLTLLIKVLLIPVMSPVMKNMKKQRDLKPELDAIKKKYPDKKKQAEMQMELFKKHNINPATGCGTQILMIMVLIALYNVIRKFSLASDMASINAHLYFEWLKLDINHALNIKFLYLDLTKPDPYYIIAVLSGILQFIASKMMLPSIKEGEKLAEKTPDTTDDMAYMMQQQSAYMMPLMNVVIGITLPAGTMLYLVVSTIFTIVQNYFIYGLGELKPYVKKIKSVINTTNE